ncbi:hypothetical protein JCM21714_2607 [Gracilibacillus boraciitolerans JCM 21714]|uniref:Cohesin domain-containing protein n=1 Tax=Gracilibacillus boraciitolerans JCM 21714 TaxID=1298598 RepID=W4VJF3_9BACI|nr:hypothetical protein [Gracilibacillus boraciitolerans]GAE93520.1 hypothetical protein JCM21714_2607 [Gracilibacillus boraciitolerans JCM 21714]
MSKAKKVFLPVLMILGIFSFNLSSSVTAQAQTQDIVVVTGDEAEEFVDATLHAVEEGEVENIAPVSAFDLEKSSVYAVGGGVTAVTVPVNGGDYSLPSNVTVFFDEDNAALQTNEMLVSKNEAGNFQVETYVDGSLVTSEDTGIAYMTDKELLTEEPSEIQPMGVKAVAACLGVVLGVGGTMATLIAIGCGGSCAAPTPVTAPPICAACIGAYALLGTGGIAGAVACFNHL